MVRILEDRPQAAPEIKEEIEEERLEGCADPNCKICNPTGMPDDEPVILEKKPEKPKADPTAPTNPNCPKCGKRIEEIGVKSVIVKQLVLTKLGPGNFSEIPIMETFHCPNCGKIVADDRKSALDMIAVKTQPTVGIK